MRAADKQECYKAEEGSGKMKQFRCKLYSVVLMMCLFFSPVMLTGISVRAADANVQVLPTDVEAPSEGCTLAGVEGSFLKPTKAIQKINKIRQEACKEGVPNPANPSEKLTMEDYVPIKWSRDLEYISRIRSAECMVSFEHTRLNGEGCFAINSPNGIGGSGEVIAGSSFGNNGKAEFGIDLWYTEKSAWVRQNENAVTGHYTAMINPNNTYVGLGCFYSPAKSYACSAAQFYRSRRNNSNIAMDESMMEGIDNCIQTVEIKNEYLSAPKFYRVTGLSDGELEESKKAGKPEPPLVVGDTEQYRLVYQFHHDDEKSNVLMLGNFQWSSGNSKIATVNQKGYVKYKKKGSTRITAVSNTGITVSTKIKITHKAVKKTYITKLKSGKHSLSVSVKKQKEVDGYVIQYSKNKK